MISNQWYVILESKEVPKHQPVGVTRFGKKLVLWRDKQGKINCISDICCHRGASLALGKIHENHIACPFHGFRYDASGKVVNIPANGMTTPVPPNFKVESYETREKFGFIWVWYGERQENYPELPFFEDIGEKFPYITLIDHWPVHYSRAIENQLDIVHIPFVHYNTIGRGMGTIIDGPIMKFSAIKGTLEEYYCNFYRKEDGTSAKKPNELEFNDDNVYIHFRFPHIWQNKILERMRIFVAFVPIDDENCVLYMRYYQNFVKIPLLKQLILWIGLKFSKKVLYQDKRVVITEIPKKTDYKMKENLITGDLPIIYYRRIRSELQENGGKIELLSVLTKKE